MKTKITAILFQITLDKTITNYMNNNFKLYLPTV